MSDSQPDHISGSGGIPNAWGNALARRWVKRLPPPLTGGFLKLMYALRTMASANGETRYARDGKGMPLREIAEAARSDVKDVRLWLSAGIAAGILAAERRPGMATVYRLVIHPAPNWTAAVAVIERSQDRRRRRASAEPAPWHEQPTAAEQDEQPREHPASNTPGDHPPTPTWGDHPPTPAAPTPGDHPPTGVGGPSPYHPGAPSPGHPWNTHGVTHEVVDVDPQPPVAREHSHDALTPARPEPPSEPPPLRPVPSPRPDGRRSPTPAVPHGQAPLLLPVPTAPGPTVTADQVHRHGWRQALGFTRTAT